MSRWTVADVMTVGAVSVRQDTSFKEIVDTLEAHGVNAVPVVDDQDRVLGIVSSADMVPKIEFAGAQDHHPLLEARHTHRARGKATATTAVELMTSPARTVVRQTSLVNTAKIMESATLKRLPVVDDLGRLIGMVTRRDLLKVFLRTDADIRREIVTEVFDGLAGLDPARVQAEVDDGVVTLLGEVARRSSVASTIRHIQRVDGVVDVISHLSYKIDDTDEQPVAFRPPVTF